MALTVAERARNFRRKLKQEERVHFSIHLEYALHSKLKARAAKNKRTLIAEITAILERQK